MEIPTLLRQAEHNALKDLVLHGRVADLGGDARSAYRKHLQGEHTVTTVNLDASARPDCLHDLETPLPFEDSMFDHVLLINVLEHVYHYRELLQEAARILKPGGSVIIVVPFLFPIHPSPKDFWRFSPEALSRELVALGLNAERMEALGTGVFAARFVLLDRLLPSLLRILLYPCRLLVQFMDWLFTRLAAELGKKYLPSDYALGLMVVGRKSV